MCEFKKQPFLRPDTQTRLVEETGLPALYIKVQTEESVIESRKKEKFLYFKTYRQYAKYIIDSMLNI